jgi:hypothetical protein
MGIRISDSNDSFLFIFNYLIPSIARINVGSKKKLGPWKRVVILCLAARQLAADELADFEGKVL